MREFRDYTGLKPNMLTAIKFIKREKNKSYWLFNCECGNSKIMDASKVFTKKIATKSCGCFLKSSTIERNVKRVFHQKDTTESRALYSIYSSYKGSAKIRGYSFNLSVPVFKKLIKENCYYCGSTLSNKRIANTSAKSNNNKSICYYNGIDRVDNSIGYELNNCVTCCKICNRAKKDISIDDFMNWLNNLSKHTIKTNN